jgi:hypothetical protein
MRHTTIAHNRRKNHAERYLLAAPSATSAIIDVGAIVSNEPSLAGMPSTNAEDT